MERAFEEQPPIAGFQRRKLCPRDLDLVAIDGVCDDSVVDRRQRKEGPLGKERSKQIFDFFHGTEGIEGAVISFQNSGLATKRMNVVEVLTGLSLAL